MDFIDAVKSAGVVGAGGAGFPSHIKLGGKADCFIVNAAECEPLIETDKYLCRNFPDELVDGTLKTAEHLGAKRIIIALKRKYKPEIAALRAAIGSARAAIELLEMDTFYPAGDEQTIVLQACGVSLPERSIPAEAGVVVHNVGTVLNIGQALNGLPVTRKCLSLTGDVAERLMLDVPLGTPVSACVEQGSPIPKPYAIILGGPMMGRVYTGSDIESACVTKTTGNILVLPEDHYLIRRAGVSIERISIQAKSACIRCRMCTDLCPRYLLGHDVTPHLVMRNLWREAYIEDGREYAKAFGSAMNCCECMACELFSCPMGLSPCKANIHMKKKLKSRDIQVERNPSPQKREGAETLKIPTGRLTARLGLSPYYGKALSRLVRMDADMVRIPLRQHIGAPAAPVKRAGQTVNEGELLAAAEGAVSANIHASISGVIGGISDGVAVIERKSGDLG